MYDIIYRLIAHNWATGTNEQSYIYNIVGALILLLFVVLIDMIYRTFRSFWRS